LIAGIILAAAMIITPASASHISRPPPRLLPAVTQAASLHASPAAHLMPASYRVRPGDTLSAISAAFYGHASRWPALWWTNHRKIRNPNSVRAGITLTLARWHPRSGALYARALRHIPQPVTIRHAAPAPVSTVTASQPQASYPAAAAPGSFRACVLRAESGGNYSAYNPSSGAGGAYQFLQSTWSGLGFPGSPQTASPAMQDAAFAKEYAQGGTSAWGPYDGC